MSDTPETDTLDEEATKPNFEFNEDNFDRAIALARKFEKLGEVVVTTDETGACVAVTRQDEEGRILETIWQAPGPDLDSKTTQTDQCGWCGKLFTHCCPDKEKALDQSKVAG